MDSSASGSGSGSEESAAAEASSLGQKRRKATDESIFGVFEDGDEPRKARRARGRAASPPKAAISFVRGAKLKGSELPPARARDADTEDDNDDIDPRFRFDGEAVNAGTPVEHGPRLPARNKLSMGQMASEYGKGFSMMKKMGFQGGGLGAREDGIANPIEVVKRKDRQGLQDKGEALGQDLYGLEAGSDRTAEEEKLLSARQVEQRQESWKRSARPTKSRTVYKTAAEVASEPNHIRIIDMRGPEVRVAASFSELAASLAGDSVKSLKELRHNARLLVAKCEDRARAVAERRKHFEDVLLSVAKEKERLEATGSLGERDVFYCRQLVKEVEALREQQDSGSVGLEGLASAFQQLQREHPREFKALRVLDVAVSLALAAAKRELAGWKPLSDPSRGVELVAVWRPLLKGADKNVFEELCEHALLPPLRAALCGWRVQDCDPCLRLLECCRDCLPAAILETVVAQVLLPRLRAEVDQWDPRVDKVPVHLWIHPWLPTLGTRLECLWAPLHFKLSACLERWQPRDRTALEVLRPWRLVLDSPSWELLMEKILLRLELSLAEMEVRPDGQDLAPMQDLLAWLGVAPVQGLARVLELAFFPQWDAALRQWLRTPSCDYEEVLQWYQGWKGLLPEELRAESSVQRHFAQGLQVMQHYMTQGAGGQDPPLVPPEPASMPERGGKLPQAAAAPAAAAGAAAEEVNLSLSDYLAEVAAEQGLLFRPKASVQHLGQQVYQLGAISIYVSKGLVYALPKGGQEGDWRLVSLDEAMSLARGR